MVDITTNGMMFSKEDEELKEFQCLCFSYKEGTPNHFDNYSPLTPKEIERIIKVPKGMLK
jgi:hypothetical protein